MAAALWQKKTRPGERERAPHSQRARLSGEGVYRVPNAAWQLYASGQKAEVYANPLQLGSSPQRVTYTERAGLWQSRSPHASASLDTSELKPGSHKGTCARGGSTPLTGAILPSDEFNLAGIAFAKGLPGPKRMGDATASREQ